MLDNFTWVKQGCEVSLVSLAKSETRRNTIQSHTRSDFSSLISNLLGLDLSSQMSQTSDTVWLSCYLLYGLSFVLSQITVLDTRYYLTNRVIYNPKMVQGTDLFYMISKSKRNNLIDRRLIPGNWFNV